jgi:DNA modification methylase
MILFLEKKMIEEEKRAGHDFIPEINAHLPTKLKKDLDILIDDVMHESMDALIVIDGKEGSGKSYDARLIGKYISTITKTPFSVPNIHFNTQNYINFSEKKPKFTINVLDEGREALNRKRGMAKSNVMFTNWISENRDKQQFHIILLPAIHDLDSYISIWRMKILIHKLVGHQHSVKTRSGYKMVRGYFRVYENSRNLQQVLHNRQKFGYYAYPREPKYNAKIKYSEVFNKEEMDMYLKKKAKERAAKYSQTELNPDYKYNKLIYNLNKVSGMTQEQIAPLVGLKRTSVGNIIREFRDNTDSQE